MKGDTIVMIFLYALILFLVIGGIHESLKYSRLVEVPCFGLSKETCAYQACAYENWDNYGSKQELVDCIIERNAVDEYYNGEK